MTSYPPPNVGGPPSPPAPGQNPAAYGAPVPPRAPAYQSPARDVNAPPVAWLVVLAGLLGLIGGVTAWYEPIGKVGGQTALKGSSLHSWDDGKIGLLGPILLILIAVGVASMLLGRVPSRFNAGSHPVTTAGKGALIAGAVALVCTIISWFLVKSQYKIDGPDGQKLSWDAAIKLAKSNGVDLSISRGAQIGFYLTIVGGILAIAGGVLMLVMHKSTPAPVAQPGGYTPAAPQGYGQPVPGGYPPPAQGGFGPPAQGGYPLATQPPSLEK